jgi:hypothetical protein
MGSSVAALQLSAEAGAPEHEIEITPEMIEAGANELIWYDINDNDPKRIIGAVLVAMGAVRGPLGFLLRKRTDGVEPPKKMDSFALIGSPGHWKILPLDRIAP